MTEHHATELLKMSPHTSLTPALELPRPDLGTLNAVDSGSSLTQLLKVVQRQKWKLAIFMALAIAAAVVVQFTIPKLYEGTAVVKIDRHTAPGVIGQEASEVSSVDDMDQIITTQIELAESDPVLRPVTEKYHLWDEERQLDGLDAAQIRQAKAAPIELKKLKIMRPPNTYLIRISYRAHNPKLAADVANAIAASLTGHANDTGNRSYAEVSALIGQQIEALKAKMEASGARLAEYEKELNMVDPEQRTTILSARLAQLNTEFTAAQADRLHKEAVFHELGASQSLGSAEAAESDTQHSLVADALQRLDGAKQQFAAARSYYGENHPEYVKAKEQLDEATRQVDGMRKNTAEKAQAEYAQAADRENGLRRVLDQTKTEADKLKESAIQYEQLKDEAENDKKIYGDLETRTREAGVNDQFRNATVQLASAARPPFEQIFPKLIIDLPVAFVLSLILGIVGAIVIDALDTTFADAEEVATQLRVDVLASIPNAQHLPPLSGLMLEEAQPLSKAQKRAAKSAQRYGEAIRILRNTLSVSSIDKSVRTLLMTSANPSEGKSTISSRLALSCAQVGKKVLLIDADLRRPTVHRQFGIPGDLGVSSILAHQLPIRDAIVKLPIPGLSVIPAGPSLHNPSDLISVGFSSLLERVSRDFDIVLVDGPPMLGFAETPQLASLVDAVMVVTKAETTSGKAVAETVANLLRVRAAILGVVINNVKSSGAGYGYYYYSAQEPGKEVA